MDLRVGLSNLPGRSAGAAPSPQLNLLHGGLSKPRTVTFRTATNAQDSASNRPPRRSSEFGSHVPAQGRQRRNSPDGMYGTERRAVAQGR